MVRINSSAIKFEETTVIFQSKSPRMPAVKKVVKKAFIKGKITNQIFLKNKNNIMQKTKATPIPKFVKSARI